MSTTMTCHFCGIAAARTGSLFCCEGCEVVSGLLSPLRSSRGAIAILPSSDSDPHLLRDYGQKRGFGIEFAFAVEPLACEACLNALAQLPSRIEGLQDVRWDRSRGILHALVYQEADVGQEANVRPSQIFAMLKAMRLSPRWVRPNEILQTKSRTSSLTRVAITGALAGNIMMLAAAIYSGLAGDLAQMFNWLQFALFVPVFAWSAAPIFRAAWTSLMMRELSVDLPLAVAFCLGSGASVAALLQGKHDLYFDSLAGFLFLILLSRYAFEYTLARHLDRISVNDVLGEPFYEVKASGEENFVSRPWDKIQKGDFVKLRSGSRVPGDGSLVSSSAEFENSWLTGESRSQIRMRGSIVRAGSRLQSQEADLVITKPIKETDFANLIEGLRQRPERLSQGSEARLGTLLVVACFAAIGALFAFGGSLGLEEILRRSVAVLIVACPCAVSFAAPLARARAAKIAMQLGFLVRESDVWEKLLNVRKMAFDKTGTLTTGSLVLASHAPLIDGHFKRIILSLENISSHPVADSLRRAWGAVSLLDVMDPKEVPGGVTGIIDGQVFALMRDEQQENTDLRVVLFREGKRVCEIRLTDEIQKFASVSGLAEETFLLSGDSRERVVNLAQRLGILPQNAFAQLSPQEKMQKISDLEIDLYVGDGTNDMLALQRAPVAVAVGGAAIEAQGSASIVMLTKNLADFSRLFALAREVRVLGQRNLTLALIYNVIAGGAGVFGLIHPLVAAVLMPVSSLVLLLSMVRGTAVLRNLEGKA